MNRLFLILSLSLLPILASGQRLFQFERSKNSNYICYDAVERDGHLDPKHPIHVYWTLPAEGNIQRDITFFQRKMAFGYKVVRRASADDISIHLTAYDGLTIRITRRAGEWVALAPINGREARLTRMFAQLRSPNSLHVEYVDLFGIDIATGQPVTERIRR